MWEQLKRNRKEIEDLDASSHIKAGTLNERLAELMSSFTFSMKHNAIILSLLLRIN